MSAPDAAHAGEARVLHSAVVLLFELLPRPGDGWSCVEGNQCETCGLFTLDFHTGDVEVCCFQEDFACLAPADAPRVCGVLGYTLYPAKGCCITLKQLYPERPEIVLKQNNTVLCAGCVGVGEKTLWSQAIYCRPPATFPLRRAAVLLPRARFWIKHRWGWRRLHPAQLQRVRADGVCVLGFMCMPKKGCCVKVMMRSRARF